MSDISSHGSGRVFFGCPDARSTASNHEMMLTIWEGRSAVPMKSGGGT